MSDDEPIVMIMESRCHGKSERLRQRVLINACKNKLDLIIIDEYAQVQESIDRLMIKALGPFPTDSTYIKQTADFTAPGKSRHKKGKR
jgi:hypothetical protein